MRFVFLLLIIACGGYVAGLAACLSRPILVSNYGALVSSWLNCLVFYLLLVAIYLAANGMKEWKFLLVYSLIVIGFFAKFVGY